MSVRSGVSRVWAFLRDKVGLHGLGLVLTLVIIAFAAVVLYRMLHDLSFEDVGRAMAAKDPLHVALAFVLVGCAYATLTLYDWFALHTIHKPVPYRVAAMAGFCSYSVGHNVGFTVFTGGSVRYRIYSAWGLGAIDVAKVCFIAGLTFWLGNIAVLGLGITIHPEAASAVDHLPAYINRLIGIAALVGLVGYVIWVSMAPRDIGRSSWFVRLPAGRSTLMQIGIGILDLSLCAAAMYMLMPGEPYIDPISLAVIFITATLLGFASHAPGGIGVFDAALLVALPQFDKNEMVGALLLFRLFYYIVPFALALVILGIREARLGSRRLGKGGREGVSEEDRRAEGPSAEMTMAEEGASSVATPASPRVKVGSSKARGPASASGRG
ncbi:UPF0104 family protein [Xanthobacter sp. TB0139]|uniref:UPF0104 family protein n=1 Tax=Xanthobacter sp. TB0139 TaxID=3459178 RepID=UPI00403A79DA